jgi:hypothetical protein
MSKKKNHHAHADEPVDPPPMADEPVVVAVDAPELLAAGPLPMGVGVMRVQKQRYRDWITAGGTPAIYT